MTQVKIRNLKKYFKDRLVLNIDMLTINSKEKVGIVGKNGCGKSTLLNIITGNMQADEGNAFINSSYSYITQLDNDVKYKESYLSGGEKVKEKINEAFKDNPELLIADEPTSNLDSDTVKYFEKRLKNFKGTLILVSHDRELLDNICTKIIEIEDGKAYEYKGNYSAYEFMKKKKRERMNFEYKQYIGEKNRLLEAVKVRENIKGNIRMTPKRFGPSEARVHKMGGQEAIRNMDNSIKALKSRIERLEVKEKPKEEKDIRIDIIKGNEFYSKYPIKAEKLNLAFDSRKLVNNGSFKIKKGSKTALLGKNGCGKTTLIKEILKGNDSIKIAARVNIGYFSQELDILNNDKSIIENIKEVSSLNESFIRIVLAGFLFKGDDVYKKVSVLSGGEKVKVSLCRILMEDNNFLILDEPTNYLDINSIKVLEQALKNTDKTMIIVSHDRRFISEICGDVIEIKGEKIIQYGKSYKELESESINKVVKDKEKEERIFVLKNRIAQVISMISIEKDKEKKSEYEKEYDTLIKELREES